jgi:N-acetylneuraminic acid mutarotase
MPSYVPPVSVHLGMGNRHNIDIRVYTHSHTHAGLYNDLYRFSAAANTWTALLPSGSGPSPRNGMGFAATSDGMLYVFGGADSGEREGEGGGSIYA